ncbi:MAG: FtsX-like permease family protein [Kouleothrix sp.]|nr:FtsX-like permease family protein [Kouleothrix sp.]
MIGVRRTKVLREIWLFKARTILVVLVIAIGVGAFGLMRVGRAILERDMQGGFAATAPAHAVLSLAPFDRGLVTRVARMPGVAAAEGRRAVTGQLAIAPDTWVALELQAALDWGGLTISRVVPEPGSPAQPPKDTILLERTTAQQFGLSVGQPVRMRLPDGREHTLTIAGLVSDQAITPSNIDITTAYGYIARETLTTLDQPRDYNRLYVRLAGSVAGWPDIEPTMTRIARAIENDGLGVSSISIPRPGKPPLWDSLNGVLFILGTMGLLTLGLSALLIVNVMWAVVTRQIPQIGVIKSLGGRRGHIMRLYLEMVLIFGALALLLALPLALGGAYGLVMGMAGALNISVVSFGMPPETLIIMIIAALLVPPMAALAPILTGARMTIREAIAGRPAGTAKAGRQGGQPTAFARIAAGVPTLLLLSVRNTFRRAGRVALTLVALSLAGAIFIAVLGVRQSLQATALAMQAESDYDVAIDFAQPYPSGDILRAARRTPGVREAEAWGVASARRVFAPNRLGGSMVLIGLPPGTSMSSPSVIAGRRLQRGDANALFVNADALDLLQGAAVGQALTLRIGDQDKLWRLVGVSARGFVPIAYIPYADFERAVGAAGYAGRLVVRTAGGTAEEQRAAEARLLGQLDQLGMEVSRSSITAESRSATAANLDIIAIMLLSMVTLVALVGGLGLASTMSINVLERTREIGVLRSLGAKTPVVRRVVLVEGLVIGLLSAAIGTIGAVPLGAWLSATLGPLILYHPLDFVFSWAGAALWLAIVAAIAIVASLAPAQSAARLTIRETLSYDG